MNKLFHCILIACHLTRVSVVFEKKKRIFVNWPEWHWEILTRLARAGHPMCVVSFVIFPLGLCLLVTCISDVSCELIVLQLPDSGIFPLWLSENLRLQVSNSVFGSIFCVSQKLLMKSARVMFSRFHSGTSCLWEIDMFLLMFQENSSYLHEAKEQ